MNGTYSRRFALVMAVVAVAALCSCASGPTAGPTPQPDTAHRGGTLRVVSPTNGVGLASLDPQDQVEEFDPQGIWFGFEGSELLKCCLARTLMSYVGATTDNGGAKLRPDLATAQPDVTADGLTWTFHLRAGMHYAPPLQREEIVAQDIIRGLQRAAKTGSSEPFFDIVQGWAEYVKGSVSNIAGLESPDAHTLKVHLLQPSGDLGSRFTLINASPLPPNPRAPGDPLGIASGHDVYKDGNLVSSDYARYIVSSGPYMIEGSEHLDFSLPAAQQPPLSGFTPGHRLTLVRNPSWSQDIDSLRPAYVDRIEIQAGGSVDAAAAGLDAGKYDLVFDTRAPVQPPLSQVAAYQRDPKLGAVHTDSRDFQRFLTLNLAVPPLDDIHVRRAMWLVLDRQHLLDAYGGALAGQVPGHLALDSLEDNQLSQFHAYATPGNHGDLSAAQKEMRQSAYDSKHAGTCDAAVCQHLLALNLGPASLPEVKAKFDQVAGAIAADLKKIGIILDVQDVDLNDLSTRVPDGAQRVAIGMNEGLQKDYLNAEDFFIRFGKDFAGIPTTGAYFNSLLGATPDQLRIWGYSVKSVPSVDARIAECSAEVGADQTRCWSELDVYLTDAIVPAIPLISERQVVVVPARLARYSFDQDSNMPALDQIAVHP
jgi:ABC-type transport system substrate-binding protein